MQQARTDRRPEEPSHRLPAALDAAARQRRHDYGEAWSVLATLISGMAVWGAIGAGVDHLAGIAPVGLVAGILVGKFAALYLVYVKYVRASGGTSDAA